VFSPFINPPVAKIVLHLEGRYDEKGQPATPYSPSGMAASLLAKYTTPPLMPPY